MWSDIAVAIYIAAAVGFILGFVVSAILGAGD